MYYCVDIVPHYAGGGTYIQSKELFDGWESESDLLGEINNNIAYEPNTDGPYELGVDELPSELPDIRGYIHDQEGRIFGWLEYSSDGTPTPYYFAIIERPDPDPDDES